jgi:hypothetical protein
MGSKVLHRPGAKENQKTKGLFPASDGKNREGANRDLTISDTWLL